MAAPTYDPTSAPRRWHMVNEQLSGRGIRESRILSAFLEVPREAFIPAELGPRAYEDGPLPLEDGQTISQPYVVAWMAEALELTPTSRVLEVGTGSGYGAAILGELAGNVVTIERIRRLAEVARARLAALGYQNIVVEIGDGSLGFSPQAPYDAIVVTAAGPIVPEALLTQLSPDGRLVMPVGASPRQRLVRVRRKGSSFVTEDLGAVAFVPLIGAQAFRDIDAVPA